MTLVQGARMIAIKPGENATVIKQAVILSMMTLLLPGEQRRSVPPPASEEAACAALLEAPNVTISFARLKPAAEATPQYCYVQGSISGRIRFHMQLPLRSNWNRRLLNIGDGGKDGVLNFADDRLTQGYAVANSNSGHDAGAEPNSSFAEN